MKVVLDTNVVISAIISPQNPPDLIAAQFAERYLGWKPQRA